MEKREKEGRCGSALIVVVSVMAFIMSIAATMAYTSSLFQDFALQRIGIEKRYRAMEALLNYGIAQCHEQSRSNKKQEDSNTTITLNAWPPPQGDCCATLQFSDGDSSYFIQAELEKDDHIVSQGRVQLFLKKEIWHIGQWSIT